MVDREQRAARRFGPGGWERGWWNATGWRVCELCGARFDDEVALRCTDCDAPVCPLCTVEVTSRRLSVCLHCGSDEEG